MFVYLIIFTCGHLTWGLLETSEGHFFWEKLVHVKNSSFTITYGYLLNIRETLYTTNFTLKVRREKKLKS